MPRLRGTLLHGILALAIAGCMHMASEPNPCPGTDKDKKADKGPSALFDWKVCKKDEKDKDKDKDDKKDEKDKKDNGNGKKPEEKKNGNGFEKESADEKEPEEEKRLDTDRPHFPEAATTVGVDRVILESGYTYYGPRNTEFREQQTAPEGLLRIGMFADWFEFRIGQSWTSQRVTVTTPPSVPGGPPTTSVQTQAGFQDLYLGVKLGLTEQEKCLPESALILSLTVPTGASEFTNDAVMPGINYDFGWDVVKDLFAIEGVIEAAGATDALGHHYTSAATGLTLVTDLTKNLQNFTEWFGIYSLGALDPGLAGPQHYIVSGFVYFIGKNMEIDIRAGVGLTDHSSNYLAGTGFSIRY